MSKNITNQVKVLSIVGSGSTLLDMLLGQNSGFHCTGELRFIWSRGFGQNQLCGCGKPFKECEFWTEVVKEAFGGFESIHYARIEELREVVERRIPKGLSSRNKAELLDPYKEYFDACGNLYQAVQKISRCEFIIDSSKNTAYGFTLANISQIDLFTIQLIRERRAVVDSRCREKVRPEIYWKQKFMGQRKLLTNDTRWNARLGSGEKLQHIGKQSALLRYEDLVQDPKKSLLRLFTEFGIEQPSLDFMDGFHANLKTSHTVSGNPVRFTSKEISIKPNIGRQLPMLNRNKGLIALLTWPQLLKK